jgi:membrane protein
MIRSEQLVEFGRRAIWDQELAGLPVWKARLLRVVRLLYKVIQDLVEGDLSLRAMSLVYTTLLSLVPLLAVSFSVLKGFGVHNQIEPFLRNVLAPLGDKGLEISTRIIEFVENVQVGVLGFVGFILLFYTVVSLMQKIERAFNFTWHITQARTFAQRFRDYLSVVVIGPVLIFASIGITGTMMNNSVVEALSAMFLVGDAIEIAGRLVPYVMIIAAFTFIYIFMPNTKVKFRAALTGGIVAGILWNTAGWVFAAVIVGSTKYTAIYSTFATLIMFMIWLYLGWLILLVGASIAFYSQHPEHIGALRGKVSMSGRVKEKLALMIAYLIGGSFYGGRPAWTAEALSQRLEAPMEAVDAVLGAFEDGGLVRRTADEPATFLPARPLDTTPVKDVIDAVRVADESSYLNVERLPHEAPVDALIETLERAADAALAGQTLKDLALAADDTPGATPPLTAAQRGD